MSSLQGTNTDFSSLAGNFLYLTTDPEDKEYYTNIYQKTFKYFGMDEPDRTTYNQKEKLLKIVLDEDKSLKSLQKFKQPDGATSILDAIKAVNINNSLSSVLYYIQSTEYDYVLKSKRVGNFKGITFFAFKNGSSKEINNWIDQWHPDRWNKDNSNKYIVELLKYHTLPFKLAPSQISGRMLELNTLLDQYNSVYNKIRIEDVNGEIYINTSQNNIILDGQGYYPTSIDRIRVESVMESDDGIVYIIEKPILPIIS
jgi:hypothetical protein